MSLSCEKFKKEAKDNFLKRDYGKALLHYSFALKESPIDQEAKLGAILADMATEQEEEAMALFDFYEVEKSNNSTNPEEKIEQIINSADNGFEELNSLFTAFRENDIDDLDSIAYEDFISHIKERGSFRLAFEDIMFSTKVIINQKDDLINFIERLIENGFNNEALNYIENSLKAYPKDEEFHNLLEKISRD